MAVVKVQRGLLGQVMGWLVALIIGGIILREVAAWLVPLVPYMLVFLGLVGAIALAVIFRRSRG